jgi:hypothetical protein
MTTGCSSPGVKSIGEETYVASGRIDILNMSLSVYPDEELPLVVAESLLVTSHKCLIILSFTLKRVHLPGKFMMAVLIKKSIPRMAELAAVAKQETRDR